MNNGIYLIGSLRNELVPSFGVTLRALGWDVFDDWFGAGHEADDEWQRYETTRGRHYQDALEGYAAKHIFAFDLTHLNRCDTAILMLPAGKSGHLELGYMIGQGKRSFVYFPSGLPERWDLMYRFATGVYFDESHMIAALGSPAPGNSGGFTDTQRRPLILDPPPTALRVLEVSPLVQSELTITDRTQRL